LAEWLYEEGIGENRAALVEGGRLLEAVIELPGRLRLGTVMQARLERKLAGGRRGLVLLESGEEAMIEPVPPDLTEGASFIAEIVREAIPEGGRPKLPKVESTDRGPKAGSTLKERIGHHVRLSPVGPDWLEEAGWSELLEEARSGEIAFTGGALRMSLTPAMTLFDVDGALPPAALAIAGAEAAGRAIRRLGIGGSIGIDLPTLTARADRQAAAAALDAVLPQPFERTAVNGFGFLHVVRRRTRSSIAELLQGDPVGGATRALLRQAERASGSGIRTITAASRVIARIEADPQWLQLLERRIGAPVRLQAQEGLAISSGHVHSQFP